MAKQLRFTRPDGLEMLLPYDESRVGEPGYEVVDDDPPPAPPITAGHADHPVATFDQFPTSVIEPSGDDSVTTEDRVSITIHRPKQYKVKGWN